MIWTTWRQHRAEAAVGAVALATLAAALVAVGLLARDRSRALGLPGCTGTSRGCGDALGELHRTFSAIPWLTFVLVAVPLVAGMFWAAPLVSREYERGTHRLAWTQSVSPLRWITTKMTLVFVLVAAAAALVGVLAGWTLAPLTPAFGGRYNSSWYDVQGLVPVACMLFALAVGVAASAVIRRTIPAMAVTLVVYAAARIPVHWIRWRFAPLDSRAVTVPVGDLLGDLTGSPYDRVTTAVPADALVHGITLTDWTGRTISAGEGNVAVLQQYCPDLQVSPARDGVLDAGACAAHVRGLTLDGTVRYQPASHFWLLQAVESAIFIGLAALLVTVTVLAVTRRRPS
jgi:hypothetical protein